MRIRGYLTAAGLMIFLCAGCARQTVVLVPDPDGHTGTAEVVTAGGKRLLEKPYDMTSVSGPSGQPSPVTTADQAFIAVTFGDALSMEPLPSEKFILFFNTGTAVLTQESHRTVATMLDAIQRRGAISIAISGHTDAAGSDQLNDRLAFNRAETVKGLLIRSGIEAGRVTVSSHGKGNPLVPTPDGAAEPRNRRVEVIIR